jgi:hypothetical protein
MSQSYTLIVLSTFYTLLAMVLVSLDGTYNITHAFFGNNIEQKDYGVGMSLNNMGFLIHILLFGALIALPMLMCKVGS